MFAFACPSLPTLRMDFKSCLSHHSGKTRGRITPKHKITAATDMSTRYVSCRLLTFIVQSQSSTVASRIGAIVATPAERRGGECECGGDTRAAGQTACHLDHHCTSFVMRQGFTRMFQVLPFTLHLHQGQLTLTSSRLSSTQLTLRAPVQSTVCLMRRSAAMLTIVDEDVRAASRPFVGLDGCSSDVVGAG